MYQAYRGSNPHTLFSKGSTRNTVQGFSSSQQDTKSLQEQIAKIDEEKARLADDAVIAKMNKEYDEIAGKIAVIDGFIEKLRKDPEVKRDDLSKKVLVRDVLKKQLDNVDRLKMLAKLETKQKSLINQLSKDPASLENVLKTMLSSKVSLKKHS